MGGCNLVTPAVVHASIKFPFNIRISVLRKMAPANHIREGVVAVGLRVERVMALEKSPICKRDRFEIFLTKHFEQNFFGF
jgi:hypothetical protein